MTGKANLETAAMVQSVGALASEPRSTSPARNAFAAFNAKSQRNGWACICDPTLAFARPKLSDVAKLWREKAGARPVPLRSDLDARSLKPYLSYMTLLERIDDGGRRYRLRIHGTSHARHAGDYTGRFVEDLIGPRHIEGYNALYDFALSEGRAMRVVWDYQVPEISYLQGETFLAPLIGKDGAANLLLSVTYTAPKSPSAAG